MDNKTLNAYSLTQMPIAMSLFPVLVFIPKYYTSDLGVGLALAANLILAVRIMDVFTDPLMGYISDRTRTRWGRRRPWVALAAPIMMLSIYMLFMPPEGAGATHLFVWMLVLSLGTTMMIIPYWAWGAELSPHYNERSLIAGRRSQMGVLGSFSAQAVPAALGFFLAIQGTSEVLRIVGITMLVLMPLCVLVTVTRVQESPSYVSAVTPIIPGLKLMWKNRPFKRLLVTFFMSFVGLNITTPLYIFFIAFVLHAEDMAIYMLCFFYLANFCAVPFWVWLSRRVGKHRAYVGSFGLIALAHPFYLLLGEGDFWWMLPITVVTGFAAGGFEALPNSMKADVIDIDTMQSGENRAGLFFSTWSFATKAAGAVGAWLALFGLQFFDFNASAAAANDADQLFGLRFLFALLPSTFYLLSAIVIWNYPITEERHAEMRAELDKLNPAAS